jgi:hypothetical protein
MDFGLKESRDYFRDFLKNLKLFPLIKINGNSFEALTLDFVVFRKKIDSGKATRNGFSF